MKIWEVISKSGRELIQAGTAASAIKKHGKLQKRWHRELGFKVKLKDINPSSVSCLGDAN